MDRIEGIDQWGGVATSRSRGGRGVPEAPAELAGLAWDGLMRLASDLGDGDVARGLMSVVGVARNVVAGSALDTSTPWVRTLAASQAGGMSDADVLFAFRIDGSQLPRLRDLRAAFSGGSEPLNPGLDPEEVLEAEWLLRMMGIRSELTERALPHLRTKSAFRNLEDRAQGDERRAG